MTTLDDIRAMSANELAHLAECGSPDSPTSPGAAFLASVRDSLVENIEKGYLDPDDPSDLVHEIADDAPDVYTHTRWLEFVDLAAYQEYPTEFEPGGPDLKDPDYLFDLPGRCLYVIADRLCHALLDGLASEGSDDDSDPD